MVLKISRDRDGKVTITDATTGKSEIVATAVPKRAAASLAVQNSVLAAHQWSRLA